VILSQLLTRVTKQRASLSVYWLGIDNDIDNTILSCQHCQDRLPCHARGPTVQKPRAECPFQEVAIDLCSHAGPTYLAIVDCYTDWPAVITIHMNTNTYTVISALRQSFCCTAIPDIVWSDAVPQFTSKPFSYFRVFYTSAPNQDMLTAMVKLRPPSNP